MKKPRILFIASNEADYLQDIVFSGLVEILGIESVMESPWNRFYHADFREYPRNLGRHDSSIFKVFLRSFSDKNFDAVIVGSAKPQTFERYLQLLPKISNNIPIIFLDGGDRSDLGGDLARLGKPELFDHAEKQRPFDFIFKREYLSSVIHPERVKPLPFALNPKQLPKTQNQDKKYDVTFWAVESDPIRTKALKLIESHFDCQKNGTTLNQTFKKYKRKGRFYLEELRSAKITLNFRGVGWDTLRYWEVPMLSRFLISQKPQILIPNNFREGKEIIYCKDNLANLLELCEYYLTHEDEREKIAQQAGEWALKFHTHTARAQEVLSVLQ